MRLNKIKSMEDVCKIIEEIGFLPFFVNEIEGFSIEESILPRLWFSGTEDGPWEWKGPIIVSSGCAYGKFFGNKAGFVSRELYPDLANYRRDGYDFDARYEDGLARRSDLDVYTLLEGKSLLSGELKKAGGFCGKNGKKGFDGIMTRLQMQGYAVIENFEYRIDKNGCQYGWGVARYTTPEYLFGGDFTEKVYTREPSESKELLLKILSERLKGVPEKQILNLIG